MFSGTLDAALQREDERVEPMKIGNSAQIRCTAAKQEGVLGPAQRGTTAAVAPVATGEPRYARMRLV